MSKLRILSPAEREFTEALCWYAERSQRAAEGFDAEFDKALEAIRANPCQFPLCDERHRYYLMNRFPYQIIFREEPGNEVVVIAVAHAKRKPRYWARRSKKTAMTKSHVRLELLEAVGDLANAEPAMRVGQLLAAAGEICSDLHGHGLWDAEDGELLEAIWKFHKDIESNLPSEANTAV
jgi:plasmid stabilization system protein ParE